MERIQKIENIIAAVAGCLAFGAAIFLFFNFYSKGREIEILVATKPVKKYQTFTPEDVAKIKASIGAVPENAFTDINAVAEKIAAGNISPNEIITTNDIFAVKLDPSSDNALVPEGLIGFIVQSSWMVAPIPNVKKNDFLSIYISTPQYKQTKGILLIDRAIVLRIAGNGANPEKILLAVTPEQANAIVQAKLSGQPLYSVAVSYDDSDSTGS